MSKYKEIGRRSFKSKWRIYLFDKIISSESNNIEYSDFEKYKLSNGVIKSYTTEYWQELEDHRIKGKKISEIYEKIKSYEENHSSKIKDFQERYIENEFPQIFRREAFDKMIKHEMCVYCGITKSEIEQLGKRGKLKKKNLRGWNLEIDRLEPNKEYSEGNCAMSCYWCNNAKTDEFSKDEFKSIGEEIGKVLRGRLTK